MKFLLVDRIVALEPRTRIVGQKALSLAEEYLADHFPTFPVLPGVFMLEACVQTSAWLIRDALDFRPSLVVLKEARNVTYKSFLAPGRVMRIEAECKSLDERESTFAVRGVVEQREIVKGRLTLAHRTLAEHVPALEAVDASLRDKLRAQFRLVWDEAGKARTRGASLQTTHG